MKLATFLFPVVAGLTLQQQPMPMGLMGKGMLLKIPEVKKEINLSGSQEQKVEQIMSQIQSSSDPAKKNVDMHYTYSYIDSRVILALNASQRSRLDQLFLQANGTLACTQKDVADKLKLSKSVREKIAHIDEDLMTNVMNILSNDENKQFFNATEIAKFNKNARKEILNLLSKKQFVMWQKLQGKPFSFPPMRFQ